MARMKPRPARSAGADAPHTPARILDVAERLAQTRGFNGFSYADIAAELGITKASLHYHFPSKSELGRALIDRYTEEFARALDHIERDGTPAPAQLESYVAIYAAVLKRGRICLCGMLAAEYTTLPVSMQGAIRAFFDLNERWLARVLEAGRAQGTLAFDGSVRDAARVMTSALEGAMLLSRPFGGGTRFAVAAERLLREFAPPPPAAATPARLATARRSRSASQPRAMR
jgi:TetR/AcrR family transcriptional regulator, transcriptional repressor for nem operon